VYLGLGLRLGSGTFAGYDADAAAYFNRATVTDATAKQQINAFVVGVKGLGLWNNMVCWPLRSAQNKGSGTTAYSLGGYGTFDGTLSGSILPTWQSTGIQSSGTNYSSYISISSTITSLISSGASIFGVVTNDVDDNYAVFEVQNDVLGNQYPSVLCNFANGVGVIPGVTRNGSRYYQNTRGGNFSAGFSSVAGIIRSTSQANFRNGSLIANETGLQQLNPTSSNRYRIANSGAYPNPGVICPFSFVSSTILSDSDVSSLHSLYKTTLGTGLGLP
jgi:hypothetical protein